jgi:putative nucleotidyltransferase with HDIG domain
MNATEEAPITRDAPPEDETSTEGAETTEEATAASIAEGAETAEAPVPDEPGARPEIAGRIAALWLTEASLERLRAFVPVEVVDDPAVVDDMDLVVVSTRGPRARTIPLARRLRERSVPLAVVCHPGGEHIALEIVRAGALAVVAEGNETAVGGLLVPSAGPAEETLLVAFEQRGGAARPDGDGTGSIDRGTGLPGEERFLARLQDLDQNGTPARVGLVEIRNLKEAVGGLDPHARRVLHRRLAVLFRGLGDRAGVELYQLSPERYAFVGTDLTPDHAHELGLGFVRTARAFTPDGSLPLIADVGHAGPEIAGDLTLLHKLAERAVETARAEPGGAVVNAEHLPTSSAASLELDLALRMIAYLSENDGYPGSHSVRVADHAAELARQLGYEGRELARIRLSGLLHDIGKVGLPPEAMRGGEDLEGDCLAAYRSHPERGARYARVAVGAQVAEAIRAHHERWDGGGFPDGIAGEDIPMAARIVAVADAYDRLRCSVNANGVPLSPAECLEQLRAGAGAQFDPTVVEAAELAFPR